MTTQPEALRLALEALEEIGLKWPNVLKAIDAVKEALETKDEPFAWMYWQSCLNDDGTQTSPWVQRYSKFKPSESVINKDITPLYTTPQPKQEAKDEPVAWRYDQAKYRTNDLRGRQWAFNVFLQTKPYIDEMVQNVTPLYTTPQRTWVGLTDEDKQKLVAEHHDWESLYFAIQAKLKEKNT